MLGSHLTGAVTAAAIGLAAGAFAESGSDWTSHTRVERAGAAELTGALDPADGRGETAGGTIGLSEVSAPERTLTNLTVYSHGVDIGHIKSVIVGEGGRVELVEIALNDGSAPAWLDATTVQYDSVHRLATTGMNSGDLKALAAKRRP
jgi:hypothetical protein